MKPGDEWRILRIGLVLNFLALIVRVTIPDYPYDYDLWYSLCIDPNGYWHELFYIVVGMVLAVEWAFRLEERQLRITRKRKLKGA